MTDPHHRSAEDAQTSAPLVESPFMAKIRSLGRVGSCAADEMVQPRKRQGGDIVQVSGSPRRLPPPHVILAAQHAMSETGYAPGRGVPALKQAVANRVLAATGIAVDPDAQIVVTNGAMQALHIIMMGLLAHGDEVIVPSPCFSYDGLVRLAGATPVYVPMRMDRDYAWDMDRIRAAITPKTKLLIVNTPMNPTGRVLTAGELAELTRIAHEHDLWMVADEAYDRLVYDGRAHTSIFGVPGAAERTILVQSATKSFAMGAWRVGWIVARPEPTTVFARMIEWMMLAVNHVAQAAAAAAIAGPQDWLEDLAPEFERNRDTSVELLAKIDGISFVVPQGGPFLLPDVSHLGLSGDAFADILIQQHGLRVSGGSYYNAPECIRIPFGGEPSAIEETFRRIDAAARSLR